MIWALFWLAVFLAASLWGWWIEHADKKRTAANVALRGQIDELSAEEERLVEVLRAHWRRQCELLDEWDGVWGHHMVNALPEGERLASKEDRAYLEALLELPAHEPGRPPC